MAVPIRVTILNLTYHSSAAELSNNLAAVDQLKRTKVGNPNISSLCSSKKFFVFGSKKKLKQQNNQIYI